MPTNCPNCGSGRVWVEWEDTFVVLRCGSLCGLHKYIAAVNHQGLLVPIDKLYDVKILPRRRTQLFRCLEVLFNVYPGSAYTRDVAELVMLSIPVTSGSLCSLRRRGLVVMGDDPRLHRGGSSWKLGEHVLGAFHRIQTEVVIKV